MWTLLLSPLALAAAQPSPASPEAAPPLDLEQQALMRCSAAFALLSYGQANQDAAALQWPLIDPRGREFFVRAMAQLMDSPGLSREQVTALLEREAQRLIEDDTLDEVMPACLAMLEVAELE